MIEWLFDLWGMLLFVQDEISMVKIACLRIVLVEITPSAWNVIN